MRDNLFESIARSIGRDNAMKLVSNMPRCGKRSWRMSFYIPKEPREDHVVVRLLGRELAEKLSQDLGGVSVQTTNGRGFAREFRNEMVRRLVDEGKSTEEVGKMMGLSDRSVRYIVSGPSGGEG